MKQNEKSRRMFLRDACCGTFGLMGALALLPTLAAEGKKTNLTPDEALAKLKKGNADFLADKATVSSQDHIRRMEIARGQIPFAVMLGCSDSRVSPELLFNTGLGELFIVRNAGNTIDTVALGSIQYGVLVLGAPLIVVLGHQRCGAVEAALSVVQKNATFPGSIGQMIEPCRTQGQQHRWAQGRRPARCRCAGKRAPQRRSPSELRAFVDTAAARRQAQDCRRPI